MEGLDKEGQGPISGCCAIEEEEENSSSSTTHKPSVNTVFAKQTMSTLRILYNNGSLVT
jgi:hypothetical protein